jgi:hypothetical protein
VFSETVRIDPFLLARGKVAQVNEQKSVGHEESHGEETDCDVVFALHNFYNVSECSPTMVRRIWMWLGNLGYGGEGGMGRGFCAVRGSGCGTENVWDSGGVGHNFDAKA